MRSTRSARTLAIAACVALLLAASPASAADGKIEGIITVKGKPLSAGRVFFPLDNGQFVGAKVKDGKYAVDRVPTGTRKITVEGEEAAGVGAPHVPADASVDPTDARNPRSDPDW